MGIFDRTASNLTDCTALLLRADPGEKLMDAVRLYDPEVRRWHGRLIFRNGVLLFGPVTVTPKLQQQARLPSGTAVAWYAGAAGQGHKRSHEAKLNDGDMLVRGLAGRVGGTVRYGLARQETDLALFASVYSEQDLPPGQVAQVLRSYNGELRAEDVKNDTYSLTGDEIYFYVAYWSPRLYREDDAPPALGAMRSRPLNHWDLNTGVSAQHAARELCQKVGEAALALATQSGGVALDVLGFPISSPADLLPR